MKRVWIVLMLVNGVQNEILKIGIKKKIYVEPVLERIELEIEEVMSESGLWTDPFYIEERTDLF